MRETNVHSRGLFVCWLIFVCIFRLGTTAFSLRFFMHDCQAQVLCVLLLLGNGGYTEVLSTWKLFALFHVERIGKEV